MDIMYIKHDQTHQSYQENQFPKRDKAGNFTQTNTGPMEVTISDNNWRTTSPDSLSQQYLILTATVLPMSFHLLHSAMPTMSTSFKSPRNQKMVMVIKRHVWLHYSQLNFRKLNLGGAYDSSDPMPV